MKAMKEFIRSYLPYYAQYRRRVVLAVSGMVLAAAATGAIAYLVKPLLDQVFIRQDLGMLYLLPVLIVAAFALKGLGTFLQAYHLGYVGQDLVRRLRERLLGHLLSLDLDFHLKMHSGEMISRINNDILRIQGAVSGDIPVLLRETLSAAALLGVVVYQSPKLALFALVVIPLAIYPVEKISRTIKRYSHRSQQQNSDLLSSLSEIFSNYEMIKSYNAQEYELENFSRYNRRFFETNIRSMRAAQMLAPILDLVGAAAISAVIVVGGREVIVHHTMSPGEFFSFLAALTLLIDPVRRISTSYGRIQDAVAAHERLGEIFSRAPRVVGGREETPRVDSLGFDRVGLSYGRSSALEEVSFRVRRGEILGLVGDSGGGKSSIVNLILRFYDPDQGRVLLNDRALTEFDLASLRRRIALVTQRVYIRNDTIAANVAYGVPPDRERVVEALRRADLWEYVQNLPEGMDTRLEEAGSNLSGGQRQRIAIARALYRRPDVLVLDEATSALDNKSEAAVMETIYALKKDLIVIMVAHRLSTVEHADSVLVLEKGRVVCRGNMQELRRNCAAFARLYRHEGGQ